MEQTGRRALHADPGGTAVPPSYAEFYAAQWPGVLAVAYSLSGAWDVAEDLAQEAFAKAWRHWTDVAVMDRPDSWVRTVAANLARSRWRRRLRELAALRRVTAARPAAALDAASGVDDDEAFWHMVRRLPERQAAAVALYYAGEMHVEEVASAMRCAPGTVRALLHQARQTLAERLGGAHDSR